MMSSDGNSPPESNYPILQEYPLESNFAQLIPAQAQRGLSTFDLEFTCLDADGSYIAIGSNVGVVYLFNREKGCMHKLKDNDHRSAVSSVKVLVSLECLVAMGYKDGAVLVYKVPFRENEELEKFTVEGLHECAITSLEWAKNGMKFFSGDESGTVVCTEIDHLEHQSRSRILLKEKSKIVQLSYYQLNLVVSTLFRSLIYSLKSNTSYQIGQKERKCFGPFGAIIYENDQQNIVFASRPGQRLWQSDMSGVIQETMIFKTALIESHPSIETLTELKEIPPYTEFQFERLARFESYILIWCDSYILIIDPFQKSIVAASPKLDPIIDITTCNKEIFILRGVRHVIRISSEPDNYKTFTVDKEPSLFEEILVPFKELSTYVKERSDSLAVPAESNSSSTIFDWLRKKRSASSPSDFSNGFVLEKQPDINPVNSDTLPAVVSLSPEEFIPVKIDELSVPVINTPELVTKDFTKGDESDDIVFKVKKKKKHKKVQFDIDAAPKREKHKFKSKTHSKEADENKKSNVVSKSDRVLENINDSTKFYVPNISDAVDSKPKKLVSNNVEIYSNIDSKNNNSQNYKLDNDISYKYDIDGDKLLENVLSAYSHSKYPDEVDKPVSVESNQTDNNNFVHVTEDLNPEDDLDKPSNGTISEETLLNSNKNNCSSEDQSAIVNQNLSEGKKVGEEKVTDADEVYSLNSTSTCKVKRDINQDESMDSLSSSSSSDMKSNDPPKYGVDWVEYRAPELLLDLSVSNDHIFCVDIRNQMYFSKHPQLGSLHWIELGQPAEKVAASDSESVVWALYKGTVFAAVHKAATLWENTEWMSIARDVVSMAVDDGCGWYAKSNGEIITQQNLTAAKPCNYPETVPCNSPALKLTVKNGVLWVLTFGGTLLTKNTTSGKKLKSPWKEIRLKDIPGIDNIFLGSMKTGWIVDSNGMIRFIIGVTPETPEGTGEPWLVEASNCLFRSAKPLEQVVRRALNTEALTNLIRGKQHLCLSTSDFGLWFCKTYDNLLYSNQKSIIGHSWELIIPPSTAVATKWKLIAADGINNSEGTLWCVNNTGELFCYCIKTQNFMAIELPSISGIRCLQPKYQSLWLLSEEGAIYVRRGITPNCLQGIWWQVLDLLQLGSEQVIHISCSSFVSWACTETGDVLMRLGSLNPSNSKLNQAWISIGSANEDAASPLVKLSAIGKHFPLPLIPARFSEDGFCKVYVGPLGYPVWAIDRKQNVYARSGVTPSLPIGEKWISVPDLQAKQLCITNAAVWLLESSGKIFRRFGVTEKNSCGDYWKQMPGNVDYLTATEDDDLWGIQNGSMFCHYSFVLYSSMNISKLPPARMISEDDWEDIMADDLDDDI